MSFGISRTRTTSSGFSGIPNHREESYFKHITCYTPQASTATGEVVSLVQHPSNPKCAVMTNPALAIIPANAIIDMIEYNGINAFSTKGEFNVGLGQLNHTITFPLIEGGTATIANEKVGGCREFRSTSADGENGKNIVLYASNVNISLESPIQSGNLRVDIVYHVKQ
jgi:hypothetical protein